MARPPNAYVISAPPLAGEVGGVGLPTEGSRKQHSHNVYYFKTEVQKNKRPLCYGKGMSQCFTCDYELRGYMAMGKQVLTLTYTHAIPFGNLRFPHPIP